MDHDKSKTFENNNMSSTTVYLIRKCKHTRLGKNDETAQYKTLSIFCAFTSSHIKTFYFSETKSAIECIPLESESLFKDVM